MNNNLNNFKIKNPFGKFLRNIFLGVLLLIIGFGGAMLLPNKNANSVDAANYSDFLSPSIRGTYKGNNNGYNAYDACAYTTVAREYDENGNHYSSSASSDGKYYGVRASSNGKYYALVYYNNINARVTARATYDDSLSDIRPEAWYINNYYHNIVDSTREYEDDEPYRNGYNFGQNGIGLSWNSSTVAVAYDPTDFDLIGFEIGTGDTFLKNGSKLYTDEKGYYYDRFDRKYQYIGEPKGNYYSIKCLDDNIIYYINGNPYVNYESYPVYKDTADKMVQLKINGLNISLVFNNSYKTGVLPTNNTSTSYSYSSTDGYNYKRTQGFAKANVLRNGELIQAFSGEIAVKGYGGNIVTVMSGRSKKVMDPNSFLQLGSMTVTYSSSNEDAKYRSWNFYCANIHATASNYVAVLQSTNTKNINLNLNGGDSRNGSASSVTLRQYDYYPRLTAIPTKAGYKFKGYYTSRSGGTQMYTADGKPTMTWDGNTGISASWFAQWELASYTIYYNNNGGTGSIGSQTVKYNNAIQLKTNTFTRVGYTFGGWTVSGLNSSVAKYGISYSGCNTTINADTIIPDKYYVKNLTGVVDGSVSLFANWEPNTYTINFDSGGGEGSMNNVTTKFDKWEELPPNKFTKTGYSFVGWKVTSGLNTKTDDKGPKYKTMFYKPGGALIENKYSIDGSVIIPEKAFNNPVSIINLNTGFNGSVTLTAQWEVAKHNLNIDFSNNDNIHGDVTSLYLRVCDAGGTALTSSILVPNTLKYTTTYSTTPLTFKLFGFESDNLSETTNNYYINLKSGDVVVSSGIGQATSLWTPTSDLNLTAEIYRIYTISAEAGTGVQTVTAASGTSGFDSNRVKYGDSATFTATKKIGYDTFDGWYNGTTKVSENLSYTLTNIQADTTLTAKAKPNTYTVSYNANGGTGSMISSSFTYDTSSYLRSNSFIAPTGKVFSGWATSSTGEVVYSNGQSVKNLTATKSATVTLYAVWGEPSSVTDGLVMNLSKWSATSSKWYDITGNGYDMTMTRGTPSVNGGYYGSSSLAFTGETTKILDLTEAITIEVDLTTGAASTSRLNFFGNPLRGYILYSLNQKFQFLIKIDGTSYTIAATSIWTANTNYHLVVTYDGSSLKLYVNGVIENSLNVSGTITIPADNLVSTGATKGFSIHKIKVFNRPLTASEVTIEQNIADYSVSYNPNNGTNTNLWNAKNFNIIGLYYSGNDLIMGSTLALVYRGRSGSTTLISSTTTSKDYSVQFTKDSSYNDALGFQLAAGRSVYYALDYLEGGTYTLSFTATFVSSRLHLSNIKLEQGSTKTNYSEPMQNVSFGDPYFWLYNNKTYTPKTGYVFNGWLKSIDSSETLTNKNILAYFNNLTVNNTAFVDTYKETRFPSLGLAYAYYGNYSGTVAAIEFSGDYSNLNVINVDDTPYTNSTVHNVAKNISLSAYITQDASIANYEIKHIIYDENSDDLVSEFSYYFDNLANAVKFCDANSYDVEIIILKNVSETTTVTINTSITLKAQDSSCGITFNGGGLTVATGKTLTIESGTYSQTSTSASSNLFNLTSSNAGSIVVNGGEFTSINNMFDVAAGNVTIKNGEFTNTNTSTFPLISVSSSGKFIINGGSYTSNSSHMIINAQEINGGNFTNNGSGYCFYNVDKITGGIFNTNGDYSGYTKNAIKLSGNPYFEKPIQINQMLNSNAKVNVTGALRSNVKIFVIGFSTSYYKRVVVSFASGLNAKDYINNFTLTNDIEQYGLYVDKSANTLNASKYVKVTFNGGDLVPNSESKTVLYGDTYGTLPGASGKGGYKFSGWRMASGKVITETSTVPTYENHTLYANASKVYMMNDWSSKNSSVAKTKILSVEFVSSMPTTGSQFDISGNLDGTYLGDGSVYAYYIANGDNYDVKIYSSYYSLYAPKTCKGMFQGFTSLISITFNNLLNTSDTTTLQNIFMESSSLTEIDLSSFKTENVEDMRGMFRNCTALTSVNLTNFNFENVMYMTSFFSGCSNLTTIISNGFKTSSKLVIINGMFRNCSSLTSVDISQLQLSTTTTTTIMMQGVFSGCSSLTEIDMSSCNFVKVVSMTDNELMMDNLIDGCTNLTMFKAPYGKPSLAITLPSGTWKNLNNINTTVGTTAYADGGVYVKYNLEEASYLNKNWFNKLKAKETGITRNAITSITFKTSSTFTSSVDVSSSLVYNICGESDYQYDCYPVTLYYSKSGSNYILEFVSSKTIYMPTDSSMLFADLTNLTEFVITSGTVEMASIANASYMFSRTALTTLDLADLDFSGLSSADGMLNISTLTQISTPKALSYKTNINLPNNQFYSTTLENGSYKGPYNTINQQNLSNTIKLAYQIYFSANGANNESCIRIVFTGESITIRPIKLENGSYVEYDYTRTGYRLNGYVNGSSVYDVGDTIIPSKNMIFEASWLVNSYNINYNFNDGTMGAGSHPSSAKFDTSFAVPSPTKTGYTFVGWTADIDENNIYAMSNGEIWNGKTYSDGKNLKNLSTTNGGAVTLTAHFEKTQGSVVARIGNQEFASLKLAVDYANTQTSGTFIIYLLKSNKETADITVKAGVTLNLVPQSTSEVQFELGTGSITNNGSLTLGYDDSMTYTDADGNALSKADLSGRFTLSSTGTTIYNKNALYIYDCKIVSGVADVKNDGKLYIKGSPMFTKGIYVVDSNLYVTGTLYTTVPVVLNAKDYFEKKGQVIANSLNGAKASSYVYNLNITGFSEGYTSKVDTTNNSIVIAKISTLSYVVDGNVVDTESYIEGEQHALKTYSKEGYAFYGWYTEDPTGKMSTITPISVLDSSVTGDYKVYGKTIKYGERGVEGYSDSTLTINVNYDENLNASSVYGVIIVEYFDEDLGVNKVYTYSLRKGTITIKGLRYATYKITIKTTLKASSDVKEYSVRTSSNTESNVNINLTKVNKGGITSSETI